MNCTICGGNAGTLNENGAHNLCEAYAARGMDTPRMDKCPACDGSGFRSRMKHSGSVYNPTGRQLARLFPPCKVCGGNGIEYK